MASLITKGTTPLDKSNTGVVNFVKIESIDESSGNITITQKISLDEHNGYLHRSQLKENDILFSIAGTLGRVTSVKSSILPANTNQALAIIRLKDGCLDYVKTYLKGKAVADFIKKNPTIGAQPNLSLEQVANLEIIIPSEDEQKIIGAFFQQLDNLITLHQCKCQIDGCRFQSPLAITWEQRKVTEIGKIYIGLVTTMTKHYTDEGTLLIRNSDIKDGKFEFGDNPIYLEKTFAEKNETRMHQIGDVITVHTGDVGTSAVITENEAKSIGFATIVTRPNPKIIDSNYLCSFLNTDKHKKWAVSISTGDGRTNYNLGDYFELVVPVPSIAEQKKIASYIQKLNRLITLHQCE